MDFSYSAEDAALGELSAQIFAAQSANIDAKLAAESDAAAGGPGVDAALWNTLGETGLLAAFADAASASVVGATLVCRHHGASLAPVPVWQTLAALLALGTDVDNPSLIAAREMVTSGQGWATVALPEPNRGRCLRISDGRLSGEIAVVPGLVDAAWCVTPAISDRGHEALYWLDLSGTGVSVTPSVTTDRRACGHLRVDSAAGVFIGDNDAGSRLRQISSTLLAATQAGVCGAAIQATADYMGARQQFGRPLASFQAPVHRLVDSFIDTDAIWLTTLLAAWRLDQRVDAASAVDVATWWAGDAGNRAVHTTQHLHGGIGSDVDYPIHRYFLWAKTIGELLGGAAAHAAHLGQLLAVDTPDALGGQR